jgi:integrase
VFNRFITEFGATTLISSITAEQFIKYRKPMEATTHPDTIDRDCGALKGWFDWAIKRQRYIAPNPIEKPAPSASIRDILVTKFEKPRNPFDADDLKKIFTVVPAINNPADYWLPILGLYTGARIGELCSASLAGIEMYDTEAKKWSIYLYGKSPQSKRQIPIHQDLIDAGFLDYLADVERCWPDADRVFPHLVKDTKNGYANKPSNAFTDLKKELKLGDDKVFHSFRKTFVSCLQYNGLGEEWRRPFVGHDSDDEEDSGKKPIKGGDAHDAYSKARFDPARLAEIVFPAFDLVKWLRYTPPLPVYKSGQFDKYFAKNLRIKLNATARKEREERTPKAAKAKL